MAPELTEVKSLDDLKAVDMNDPIALYALDNNGRESLVGIGILIGRLRSSTAKKAIVRIYKEINIDGREIWERTYHLPFCLDGSTFVGGQEYFQKFFRPVENYHKSERKFDDV